MELSTEIMSDIITHMKYAKYLPEEHRRETFEEIVTRNKEMHIKKFPHLKNEIDEAYELVYQRKILPSGRSLQFAGKAIEMSPARIYNCSALAITDIKAFSEIMYLLLMGTGTGYSIQKHHVRQLPPLKGVSKPTGRQHKRRFLIQDSIVGWADAVRELLESHFYGEREIDFDFRDIRKKGSPLKTSGGHAPGPEPLRVCLLKISSILENAVATRGSGTKITTLEAHDIICHLADAVLCGGIRRCLPKGASVFTVDGIKNIEDVVVGDMVYTTDGLHPVLNNFVQGVQKVCTIHTEVGDFEATKNHKMAVLSDDGSYIWKRVDELVENDRLLHFNELVGGTSMPLPKNTMINRPVNSTTCRELTIPELDTAMAWFIGYFHGNGTVFNRNIGKADGSSHITIAMNSNNLKIVEQVTQQMERFGIPVKVYKRPNENTITVNANSQMLVEYFEEHIKKAKVPIVVPSWIMQNTVDIRGAYLAGIIDSDGSIGERGIKLCSSIYPEFISQLKVLYSSLGIPTRGYATNRENKGWNTLHTLSLPAFRDRYNSYVGIYSVKGELRKNKRHHGFTIPKEIAKTLVINKDYRGIWSPAADLNYETSRELKGIKDCINEIPIKVLSVEYDVKEIETYDIEVEDKHEFFANGILTHNSATIALFSLDDEDMLTCKYGDWWEKNPQRGRANNSVVVDRKLITKDVFDSLWKKVQASGSGEPGIFFTNDIELLTNPCFTGDMQIYTADGFKTFKELDGIRIDIIDADGMPAYGKVWESGTKQTIHLVFEDGSIIKCTPDHKFMGNDKSWYEAKDLLGKEVYTDDRTNAVVVEIRAGDVETVYDFTVPTTHSGWIKLNDVTSLLVSNCAEVSLQSFSFCNLSTINATSIVDQEDFNLRAKMASRIATLQAAYTDFYYLRKEWRENVEDEALIGVSITGVADEHFLSLNMKEAAAEVMRENEEFAAKLGINKAARTTAIKPEGTASLVLGTSSGVHAWYAQYYWRRISVGKDEPIYAYLRDNHPELLEDDYFKPTTMAKIKVPMKAPEGAMLRYESALDTLERVKRMNLEWIQPGHREGANFNNTSCTISVRPEEWKEVGEWMWNNRDSYTGIAVLPYDGGTYTQSPFEECTKEEYDEAVKYLTGIDLTAVYESDDNTNMQGEVACGGGACEIK